MPVLPKHLIDPDQFEKTTLNPLVGSGPYTISKVDPGKSIAFKRDPNYYEIYSPLQSLGFAIFLNLLFVAFFNWQTASPLDCVLLLEWQPA